MVRTFCNHTEIDSSIVSHQNKKLEKVQHRDKLKPYTGDSIPSWLSWIRSQLFQQDSPENANHIKAEFEVKSLSTNEQSGMASVKVNGNFNCKKHIPSKLPAITAKSKAKKSGNIHLFMEIDGNVPAVEEWLKTSSIPIVLMTCVRLHPQRRVHLPCKVQGR